MAKWSQQPTQRVCVVGLDGVPCSMIRRFVEAGVMPRIGEVARAGALQDMTVSLPEISSVSWSTFMTGKNPGEHGIFGFTDLHPGTYTQSFPSFRDLKTDTIWDRIGEHKMRSVVINQPATYPARPVHGALVSGFVAVHLDKSVFPARYLRTVRDLGYEIDLGKAAERLGGDRERIRALPRARLYDALEDLGADRYLLGFVGSWGDTMNDGEVLKELRAWNRNGGRFRFDRLIASTGGKRG